MEIMKASRRKQTKPNRVPFGVDPQTGAFLPAYSSFPKPPPFSQDDALHDGGSRTRILAGEEADGPLDMSTVGCRLCPENFSSSAELHDHMEQSHGSRPDSDFPTAYHRLGSQLLHENSVVPNGHPEQEVQEERALSLTPVRQEEEPRDHEMDMAKDTMGEGRSVKVNGGKIFHLDAYCALCDREFCNKYFLKTHKANKHGIYEDTSPSTPVTPDITQKQEDMSFLPPPPKEERFHSPWQQQQQHHHLQQMKKEHTSEKQPAGGVKKSEAELATEEKVSSVISAVKNSMQNGPAEGKSSSSTGSASGSGTKEPSMEDYCEICQKHFCNKYYLKKHKQDVHGIIPESGPTPTKRSRTNSNLLDLPMSSSSLGSPMLLPQSMASLGGMPTLPPGMMVLNPFMPQMTLIPTGSMPPPLLHQLHPPPHSPVMSQPLALPCPSPTAPSSRSSDLSPNPDTYCRLCRKEFSNSYFLKIHRANRHGIDSEDISPEARILGDMVETNGVVANSPQPPSLLDTKRETPSKGSPPPLTSVNQSVTCRLCDKDFPTAQDYKQHQMTEHDKIIEPSLADSFESSFPKGAPPVHEGLRHMTPDIPSSHSGVTSSRGDGNSLMGSAVAAKLADRVVCDICNKDLCNKYFLKSHKLKMHGIDVDSEEGRESRLEDGQRHNKGQPLNMTVSSSQGPPPLVMPKMELNDFPDYSKDFKAEKPGVYKPFRDVPSLLSETINNEYFRVSNTQPPFKSFDFGMPGYPPLSSGKQLVEDGIDPEVYCDICKKEFCSKYFLRTHKENIHGIKMEPSPPERGRTKSGVKSAAPKLNAFGGSNSHPMSALPLPGMPFPFPPGFMMGPGSAGGAARFNRGRDNFEKHHFRWKDPPTTNATARVTCDICNKEVCNKYFLRTHKLKKHGISPTETTASPMSGSPAPEPSAGSSGSSQPDSGLVDKGTGMVPRSDNLHVPQTIPLPPSERSSKQGDMSRYPRNEDEKQNLQNKQSVNNNSSSNNNKNSANTAGSRDTDSVRCHLCDRKFRDLQWLSAHLVKDHVEAYTPEVMDLRMLPPPMGFPPFGGELEPRRCQVCHLMLPNEIRLQLHLLQEHNAQIRLQMDEEEVEKGQTRSVATSRAERLGHPSYWKTRARKYGTKKLKMFVCSYGDYRTHWLYKLQAHEEEAHNICTGGSKEDFPPVKKTAEENVKRFKCGLCPSHFSSHNHCQLHLRETHVHVLKDFAFRKRQRVTRKRLSCKVCSFTTSFPFRLHSHVACYHHHLTSPSNGRRKNFSQQPTSPPSGQRKTFDQLPHGMGSETPPESLHSSPDHSPAADPGFEQDTGLGEDVRSRVVYREAGTEQETGINLSDKLVPAVSKVTRGGHDSDVSASFHMAEVTP